MNTEWGRPYTGAKLDKLKDFLAAQGLRYDEGITDTVILSDEGGITATGSIQGNVIKCVAVDPEHRGENLLGQLMTIITGDLFARGITHYFGFTKPENDRLFAGTGLYEVARTKDVLLLENRRNGLAGYLKKIKKETEEFKSAARNGNTRAGIGCIVAHANPFTLGHRYLVETALKECSLVHLFILSESGSAIPANDRYLLAKAGISDLDNVILHKASDYIISPATFPTYFIKEQARADEINCGLDVEIFAEKIAPALGITKRFIGTEPTDEVTAKYNEILKAELPKYGIEVREIERLKIDGSTVSASRVRKAVNEGAADTIETMVPETTYEYLREKCYD